MNSAPGKRQAAASGADRWWALGLAAACLGLYATTLCRTVYFYDSAELAAASALLGVPHPPGYPLYTLLGHLYVLLVPGEPALSVNVMSAVHGAACVGLAFMVQRRLGAGRPEAALGAACLGTGASFWWNSSVAEVYTTGLVPVLLTYLLLFEALDRKSTRLLLLAGLVAGLGFATHMFIATLGLGYVWLVWSALDTQGDAAAPHRWTLLGKVTLAVLLGAGVYLYLPLRAAMQPAINVAQTDDPERLAWLVTGGEYKRWFLDDFEISERLALVSERLALHLSWAGTLLGAIGVARLWRSKRAVGVALSLSVVGNVAFFFAYRVDDLEVFFLPSAVALSLALGPLLTEIGQALAHRSARSSWLQPAFIALCALLLIVRAVSTYPAVDLSSDDSAYEYGRRVAEHLPPGAVVVSTQTPPEWKYRTVFDDYFQKTLGARPDVLSLAIGQRAALFEVLRSPRPAFMYVHVPELEPYVTFTPDGPLYRIAPHEVPAR